MNFWNTENIQKALINCRLYNFPENWTSSGFRIWHTDLGEHDVVIVRSPGETKGAVRQNIMPFLDKIAAIMCTNHKNFEDLNLPIIEIDDVTKALFSLGKYIRKCYNGKVIAITGSAGKSTTTKMIYDIVEEYGADANLNLANTLIAICWNMTTFDINKKYWVIESSIGNGYAAFPDIAVVTNLAAVHLKEGQTVEGMAHAKSKIFATMLPGATAVLNRDMQCFEIFESAALEKKLNIVTFGKQDGVDIRIIPEDYSLATNTQIYKISQHYMPEYLLYDIAAAIAVANISGLPFSSSLDKLKNFKSLKGRGETSNITCEGKNIILVDEAFNANPLSMSATIEAFGKNYDKNKVLFLGEMTEGGDKATEYHLALISTIRSAQPSRIIFCGNEMKTLFDILQKEFECYYFDNINKLLPKFKNFINDNDNVFIKSSHATGLHKIVDNLKNCN